MQITPRDLNNKALHELFMSAFLPRPIAFVSTIGADGVLNAAPFSSVAPIGLKSALVCFNIGRKGNGQKKDTLKNIESCGEFVVNVVDEALAEQMNQAAADYPPEVDEFKKTGLTPVKSLLVKPPVIGESPVNMECKLKQILKKGSNLLLALFFSKYALYNSAYSCPLRKQFRNKVAEIKKIINKS